MNLSHIISLQSLAVNVQIAHWQADTLTSAHETLGELYASITGLTDSLAEVAMGKNGSIEFPAETIAITPNAKYGELIASGLTVLSDIRAELKTPEDDDLLNIVADLSAALNKAKYLLKA